MKKEKLYVLDKIAHELRIEEYEDEKELYNIYDAYDDVMSRYIYLEEEDIKAIKEAKL